MKSKKLSLPAIIIATAILVIALYAVITGIAFKPTVTEGSFPFTITYELDGETITINDVYTAHYVRNDGYADTKSRVYVGEIGDMGEGETVYTLKKDKYTRIVLYTHFYPDYLMGDTEYDYFDDEPFEPKIYYYDAEEQEYGDEDTLSSKGVKLIGFEYPTPIENSFVFSHISYCSGAVVIPAVLIAFLALGAILIWLKREIDIKNNVMANISIILNFVICLTLVPFLTIVGVLIDINGGGPELSRQILYFFASFSVLCVAASVALRRKGYIKKSLVAQLVAPAAFAVYVVVCSILEML